MKNTFSLSEVFRLAEQIERNGFRFYQEAAKASKNLPVKQLLDHLALQEKKHEQIFADLHSQLCGGSDLNLVDLDDQVELYIRSMAYGHVFKMDLDVPQVLTSLQTERSMLQLAITFEKDTIVFFESLKKAVAVSSREKVELLIQEEIGHIHRLQEALKNC
jgi:rubrerythrin